MSTLVRLSKNKDNDIAIITIDNPPVNALSPGVPEGIANAIEEINNDPSVKAAVLIGGGRTFVAGADIKEFGKMTSGRIARRRPSSAPPRHRKLQQACSDGDSWRRFWRRAGAGDGRPLSRGLKRCAGRPARSEARPHSRCGGNATPSSACRRRQGA